MGAVHELNNPSSVVLTNLSMMTETIACVVDAVEQLRRMVSAPPGQERISQRLFEEEISQPLHELNDMVNDNLEGMERLKVVVKSLAEFARLERLERAPCDMNRIMSRLEERIAPELSNRARLMIGLEPLPIIDGDADALERALFYVLANAGLSIEEGAPDLHSIRVTHTVLNSSLVLTIDDTGTGVPEEHQDLIFKPFFSTRPKNEATGVGLSLAFAIIQAHGGTLELTPRKGPGSRFTITLPLSKQLQNLAQHKDKILLVDDDPSILKAFERALRKSYEVVTASNGTAALELLERSNDFDLVVCDLSMPHPDGIAIHQALSQSVPELARSMMFCTGGTFEERTTQFLQKVDNPCMEKTLPPSQMVQKIALAIERRRQN